MEVTAYSAFADIRQEGELKLACVADSKTILAALYSQPSSSSSFGAIGKLKRFYAKCQDKTLHQRNIEDVLAHVEVGRKEGKHFQSLGGWPLLGDPWSGARFDLTKILVSTDRSRDVASHDAPREAVFLHVFVQKDWNNASRRIVAV